MILYAVWKKDTYNIIYNSNGGSGAPASQTKTYGKTLNLRNKKPKRIGYIFQGWSSRSTATIPEYQSGGYYTANASVTLYAVWKPITYKVAYHSNGGTGTPASQTKIYGVTLTLSRSKPKRNGYIFLGWSTNSRAFTPMYISGGKFTVNKNVTLYAVWKSSRF